MSEPPKVSVCDNCGKIFPPGWSQDIDEIPDILKRLTPGGTVPSGECDACGALTFFQEFDYKLAQEAAREHHNISLDDFQELEEDEAQFDDDVDGGFWCNIRVFVPLDEEDFDGPLEYTTEDGYTFTKQRDGSYTDGDITYSSYRELVLKTTA